MRYLPGGPDSYPCEHGLFTVTVEEEACIEQRNGKDLAPFKNHNKTFGPGVYHIAGNLNEGLYINGELAGVVVDMETDIKITVPALMDGFDSMPLINTVVADAVASRSEASNTGLLSINKEILASNLRIEVQNTNIIKKLDWFINND